MDTLDVHHRFNGCGAYAISSFPSFLYFFFFHEQYPCQPKLKFELTQLAQFLHHCRYLRLDHWISTGRARYIWGSYRSWWELYFCCRKYYHNNLCFYSVFPNLRIWNFCEVVQTRSGYGRALTCFQFVLFLNF